MGRLPYIEIWAIIDPDGVKTLDFDFERYREGEKNILTPALEDEGWTVTGEWYTGEKDSFGPLSRCIRAVSPEGMTWLVTYG